MVIVIVRADRRGDASRETRVPPAGILIITAAFRGQAAAVIMAGAIQPSRPRATACARSVRVPSECHPQMGHECSGAATACCRHLPEARLGGGWVALMLSHDDEEGSRRYRPPRPSPFVGCPSGHATAAAAFFGAVLYLAGALRPPTRTILRAAAGLAIVLVAVSRVMLRAHWPSDVIGGVALGLALASAAALLARAARPVRG